MQLWWKGGGLWRVTIKQGMMKHRLRETCLQIQALLIPYHVILGKSLFKSNTNVLTTYCLLLKALELQCWKKTMAIANIFSYIDAFNPYRNLSGVVLLIPKPTEVQMGKVVCTMAGLRQFWGWNYTMYFQSKALGHWATGPLS